MEKQDKIDEINKKNENSELKQEDQMTKQEDQIEQISEEEYISHQKEINERDHIILQLNEDLKKLNERLLRQMAESENIRSRSEKLISEARSYAIFNFAKSLVPVMDNFNMALDHLPKELNEEMKNIVDGMKMTKNELAKTFENHGIESIKPQSGEKFDYNLHHAISKTVTKEYNPGSVVNVMQSGYKIKDRLIRPATVSVAKRE